MQHSKKVFQTAMETYYEANQSMLAANIADKIAADLYEKTKAASSAADEAYQIYEKARAGDDKARYSAALAAHIAADEAATRAWSAAYDANKAALSARETAERHKQQ